MKEKKALLEFETGINHKLNTICEPLFQNTPVTCFTHIKFLSNNSFIHMCSDLGVAELSNSAPTAGPFFQDFLRQVIKDSPSFKSFIWPLDPQNDPVMAKIKDYGVWNGMTMYRYMNGIIHAWSFAGKDGAPNIHNFYHQNHSLLRHFINYFNEKYKDTFKGKEFIAHYDIPMAVFSDGKGHETKAPFFNLPIRKIDICHENKIVPITMKEWEIIQCIAQGYSAKEIAQILKISYRTVEYRTQTLRERFRISLKSQFYKIWRENS